jgi:hypothetical protein
MTRWLPRLFTGSSKARLGALAALAAGLLASFPAQAKAQALKLETLVFPPTTVVGPWVSYRVRTQSRSLPIREYTQRVAVVGRETYQGQEGFWVELKTEGLPSGTRIERGFFAIPSASPAPSDAEPGEDAAGPSRAVASNRVRLVRYQVLTSGGKLYEYPIERVGEARTGGEVSTMELFEYDSSIPPLVESLGPDTLRIGRRIVPTVRERTRRAGADDWPIRGDTTVVNRPVLTTTTWNNPAVPITGLARSLFQVSLERVPAAGKDTAPITSPAPALPESTVATNLSLRALSADSTAVAGPPPTLSWTELVLADLGADAVSEVTQKPEPLPADAPSRRAGFVH